MMNYEHLTNLQFELYLLKYFITLISQNGEKLIILKALGQRGYNSQF